MTSDSTPAEVDTEVRRLLDFASASRSSGGFAHLDRVGRTVPDAPLDLWITSRMTHVFGLATRLDPTAVPAGDLLDHGVEALLGPWADPRHGGWYAALAPGGDRPVDDRKDAYAHAFVVLAGATATGVGHPRGRELLDRSLEVFADRFWEPGPGMVRDSWDRAFTATDTYRGLNAAMHSVEALLASYDVTGEGWPLEAATRIAERVVELGAAWSWRLPEHFTPGWEPLPDYNRDRPADPFRPYGATIGHLHEWSRLLLHLRAAGVEGGDVLVDASTALTRTAVGDGWAVDDRDGFVYTVDFSGVPVVTERMHWVVAEAMANAWLRWSSQVDGDALVDHERWTAFAWEHHRDPVGGSWWHELSPDLRPSATVWPGKPDVYHALQALWLPRLAPVGRPVVSFVGAARREALGG